MALYKGRLFRPVLWLALLIIAMFSSGCRTTTGTSPFTTSGSGWHTQEGGPAELFWAGVSLWQANPWSDVF
jgi:hypothetical protein